MKIVYFPFGFEFFLISKYIQEYHIRLTSHLVLCSSSWRTPRASSCSARSPRSPRGRPRWWTCSRHPPSPRRRWTSSKIRSLRSPSHRTRRRTATPMRVRPRASRRRSCRTRRHLGLHQGLNRALGLVGALEACLIRQWGRLRERELKLSDRGREKNCGIHWPDKGSDGQIVNSHYMEMDHI